MINMMYLVLIALLALNVSKEVLDAFVLINHGLVRTTENFAEKNEKIYANFERAAAENESKAGPWKRRAFEVKDKAEAIYQYIEDLKIELVIRIDQLDADQRDLAREKMKIKEGVENKSDLDRPATLMINERKGEKLKEEIKKFKEFMIAMIKPVHEGFKLSIANSLDTSDPPPKEDGTVETWESEHFEHLPAIAVICNMTQMQSAVRNAEAEIIAYLEMEIDAGSMKFNKVGAIVIPEKTYVTQGDTFRADVFIAASDSLTPPIVTVGEFDTVGAGQYKMVGDYDSLPVQSGRGKMKVYAKEIGTHSWGGVIYQKTTEGLRAYPFVSEYQVAEPSINVTPDKMLVFYIGPDNPVTVSVSGFGNDKVRPNISGGGGRIRPDARRAGGYIVTVSSPGKARVSVEAEISPGKYKNMGYKEFRVKRPPPPIASFMGLEGEGKITRGKLKAAQGLLAKMKNFDFELKFKVTSFDMSVDVGGGLFQTISSKNNRLTDTMKKYLKKSKKGQRIIFENVRAKSPKTPVEKIPGITLKVM